MVAAVICCFRALLPLGQGRGRAPLVLEVRRREGRVHPDELLHQVSRCCSSPKPQPGGQASRPTSKHASQHVMSGGHSVENRPGRARACGPLVSQGKGAVVSSARVTRGKAMPGQERGRGKERERRRRVRELRRPARPQASAVKWRRSAGLGCKEASRQRPPSAQRAVLKMWSTTRPLRDHETGVTERLEDAREQVEGLMMRGDSCSGTPQRKCIGRQVCRRSLASDLTLGWFCAWQGASGLRVHRVLR